MSVFELVPKNVVISHIVPHLTYKQRTKLYSTCRHFWSMKTNEYIFGQWVGGNYIYDLVHLINKRETGFITCSPSSGRSYSLNCSANGDTDYFRKNKKSIKRKLDSYWNQFGAIGKKQRY